MALLVCVSCAGQELFAAIEGPDADARRYTCEYRTDDWKGLFSIYIPRTGKIRRAYIRCSFLMTGDQTPLEDGDEEEFEVYLTQDTNGDFQGPLKIKDEGTYYLHLVPKQGKLSGRFGKQADVKKMKWQLKPIVPLPSWYGENK